MPMKPASRADLDQITDNALLSRWGDVLSRHPQQDNRLHEADAEIIVLAEGRGVLAFTVDTVAEEIALGLYRDLETAGWVAAMSSLSDLAACGAQPLGLLASVSLPRALSGGDAREAQDALARGLEAACRRAKTFVLGGDTNDGPGVSVGIAAAGLIEGPRARMRTGIEPGDILFTTGRFGAGAALAAIRVLGLSEDLAPESGYRPVARLAESLAAGSLAHAGMDTSDGCLHTLDQLARVNGVSIRLSAPVAQLLDPTALAVAAAAGLPPLAMLAAHHGEFELVLAVRPQQAVAFTQALAQHGHVPIEVARAEAKGAANVCLSAADGGREIPMERVRNLLHESGGDLTAHATSLVTLLAPLAAAAM